ncbi:MULTISPECIES: hypothetical protein [unclassified Streptomyces]|uniref:hypothetical protein n=1 Tax=unclassified Streptomyces TaxID=2593676 RepID=UPI00352CC6FE
MPVAGLKVRHTAAVWLTADVAVLRARVHAARHYDAATTREQLLMDAFLARTERYQRLMLDAVDGLGLDLVDAGAGHAVAGLAESVLAAAGAQDAVGRRAAGG